MCLSTDLCALVPGSRPSFTVHTYYSVCMCIIVCACVL